MDFWCIKCVFQVFLFFQFFKLKRQCVKRIILLNYLKFQIDPTPDKMYVQSLYFIFFFK